MPLFRQKLSKNVKPGKPGVSLRGSGGPGGSQECLWRAQGPSMERPWRAQGPPQGARGSPPEDRPGAKPQENELKTLEKHAVNAGKTLF